MGILSEYYDISHGGIEMKCTKCGNELKDTAKFCPFCGEKVTPAEDKAAEKNTADIKKAADEIIFSEDMKKAEEVVNTPIPPKEPAPYNITPETADAPAKKHTARNVIITVCVIIALAGGAGAFAYPRYIKPALDYSAAEQLMASGEYGAAAEAFYALNGYKDSKEREHEAYYQIGKAAMESGNYDTAQAMFLSISGYADAAQLETECRAKFADSLAASGNYEAAAEMYLALGDTMKYESSILSWAEQLASEGDFAAASEKITKAGLTSPQAEEAIVRYAVQNAEVLAGKMEFDKAIAALAPYKDKSCDNVPIYITLNDYIYQNALAKCDSGDLTEQDVLALAYIGNYKDSAMQLPRLFRSVGQQYTAEKNYLGAYAMYTDAGDYKSSPTKASADLYSAANAFSAAGDHASAATIFAYLDSFGDCPAKLSQEMSDPINAARQGWYGLIMAYSGEYAVTTVNAGGTLTVKGAVKHSSPSATAEISVKMILPDGTEQSVSCGRLQSNGAVSAQLDVPADISGGAEIQLVLDSSGMVLLELPVEITS